MKEDIKKLRREDLEVLLSFSGEPAWRVDEILRWIYRRGVRSFDEMTSLPKALRETLDDEYRLFLPEIVDSARGVDGRAFPWGDRFAAELCKNERSHRSRSLPEPVGRSVSRSPCAPWSAAA